jgi:hypothetical protein
MSDSKIKMTALITHLALGGGMVRRGQQFEVTKADAALYAAREGLAVPFEEPVTVPVDEPKAEESAPKPKRTRKKKGE